MKIILATLILYLSSDLKAQNNSPSTYWASLKKNEIEKKGIKLSLKKAENADLKLVVVDAKSVELSPFLYVFVFLGIEAVCNS